MNKLSLFVVLSLSFSVNATAQQITRIPPEPNENWELRSDDCKQITPARQKVEDRTDLYEKDVADYKKGKFCSACKRTASQIERAEKITFASHLAQDQQNRKEQSATPQMYAELYRVYKLDWNALYKQYQHQLKACTEANIAAAKEHEAERKNITTTFNTNLTRLLSELNAPDLKGNSAQTDQLRNQVAVIKSDFQNELNKGVSANIIKLRELNTKLITISTQISLNNTKPSVSTSQPKTVSTDGVTIVSDITIEKVKKVSNNDANKDNIRSGTTEQLLKTRDYANSHVGLTSNQIAASSEIGNNLGAFMGALIRSGNTKYDLNERQEERFNEMYMQKALSGDLKAMRRVEMHLRFSLKQEAEANEWVEKLSDAGDLEYTSKLAIWYYLGRHGYSKSYEKYFELSNKLYVQSTARFSSNPKDIDAYKYTLNSINDIANCYGGGRGITRSDDLELVWLKKGASLGGIKILLGLGRHYSFLKTNMNIDSSNYYLSFAAKIIDSLTSSIPDLYTNYKHNEPPISSWDHSDIYQELARNCDGNFDFRNYQLAIDYYSRAIQIATQINNDSPAKYRTKIIKDLEKRIILCKKNMALK